MSEQKSKRLRIANESKPLATLNQSVNPLPTPNTIKILHTTCYLQSICSFLSLTNNINSIMLLSKYHCNLYNDKANKKLIQLIVS